MFHFHKTKYTCNKQILNNGTSKSCQLPAVASKARDLANLLFWIFVQIPKNYALPRYEYWQVVFYKNPFLADHRVIVSGNIETKRLTQHDFVCGNIDKNEIHNIIKRTRFHEEIISRSYNTSGFHCNSTRFAC